MKQAFFQLFPEKQETILKAALAEFGANDFAAASLDRIVTAAGISKGGLYEYISSKEELYLYCMEQSWEALYRYIKTQVLASKSPLPDDILQRFNYISRIAIEWYLQHPAMLGLIVRIARLPRDGLAVKAQEVFDRHFFEAFAGLDAGRLAYPVEQLIDLLKWLLAKTRKDVLLEMEAGTAPEEVRAADFKEWEFFGSVLSKGIYQTA